VIVAITGLRREARIVMGEGVRAIACGGRADVLRRELNGALDYRVRGIISFGICAGLSPDVLPGSCIIASEIVTPDEHFPADGAWAIRMRRTLPDAIQGPVAGVNSVLRNGAEKSALFARTGALAADMESGVGAQTAQRHNLPFACLRCVADHAVSDLPDVAIVALRENGTIDVAAILGSLVRRPGQIPALIRLTRESNSAFAGLLRCRRRLGSSLAGPDFQQGQIPCQSLT
jgi:hopanoid-associated phosphorylase